MKLFITGSATWNSMIYLHQFPDNKPHTLFSKSFHETVGGTGAGKSLSLSRLGFDTTFHTVLGRDLPGELIEEAFLNEKLLLHVDIDPLGTERHTNLMDDKGQRISILCKPGTFDLKINPSRHEKAISDCDTFVLNINNYCRQFIPIAKKFNKKIWCDIHDYNGYDDYHKDFIAAADCILFSSDQLEDYLPFMHKLIKEQGKELVICTHGSSGACALDKDGVLHECPIAKGFTLIDSNGAGDNFFSGCLYGHLNNLPVPQMLKLGASAAALCINSKELAHPQLCESLLLETVSCSF
jgi:sugar/nucleoside kinase (ribokinase family)